MRTVAWLTLGAAVGGAALGAVLGLLGQVSAALLGAGSGSADQTALAVLVGACAVVAVWDLSGQRLPGRRQVNEDWLVAYRPWVYGLGFGLQLGAAVVTVVNTALVPLFMLAALLVGDIAAGLAIGAVFGAVRGVSVLAVRRVRNTEDLSDFHRRLDRHAESARRLAGGVAAALGTAAMVILLNPS